MEEKVPIRVEEVRWKCPVCQERFRLNSECAAHIKVEHGERVRVEGVRLVLNELPDGGVDFRFSNDGFARQNRPTVPSDTWTDTLPPVRYSIGANYVAEDRSRIPELRRRAENLLLEHIERQAHLMLDACAKYRKEREEGEREMSSCMKLKKEQDSK